MLDGLLKNLKAWGKSLGVRTIKCSQLLSGSALLHEIVGFNIHYNGSIDEYARIIAAVKELVNVFNKLSIPGTAKDVMHSIMLDCLALMRIDPDMARDGMLKASPTLLT